MAQIREFESTTESYFILDGVNYPKVYEAMLDNGYSDTKIKLVGTNRDTTPLVFSTEYTNIRVDGDSFDTASEAISRLNQVVFSKGGGSGGGGTTGDFIPLTGTEVGKHVTGEVLFDSLKGDNTELSLSGDLFRFNKGEITLKIQSRSIIVKNETTLQNSGFVFNNESISVVGDTSHKGIESELYYGENYTDNSYIQKKYVDTANSYSTEETKTGGTWIDDKEIYTITQLTTDTPPTYDTLIDSQIKATTYTEYEYTKP